MLFFALLFAAAACVFELYLLFSYVRSRGKYPPFVVSFGRSKRDILKKASEILEAAEKSFTVADLGCGSGSLLTGLAEKFPRHRFYGYEWDVVPYFFARRRARRFSNLEVFKKNFMEENLSSYDLLLCYVGSGIEEELGYKLNEEINENCLVLSECFRLAFLREKEAISSALLGIPVCIYVYEKSFNPEEKKGSEVCTCV